MIEATLWNLYQLISLKRRSLVVWWDLLALPIMQRNPDWNLRTRRTCFILRIPWNYWRWERPQIVLKIAFLIFLEFWTSRLTIVDDSCSWSLSLKSSSQLANAGTEHLGCPVFYGNQIKRPEIQSCENMATSERTMNDKCKERFKN